jgi:DNA-binding transcriptional LysR family regulator
MQRGRLDNLQAFVAVARERSFTSAAAKLGISQLALSHTVRQLEERLGVRLLSRTTRSVSPTEAGKRLLHSIGPRFDEIEAEVAAVSELREKAAGTIPIAATENAARQSSFRSLRRCCESIPTSKSKSLSTTVWQTSWLSSTTRACVAAKDMIAVRIGPDMRTAVVGASSYFQKHPEPKTPGNSSDTIASTCDYPRTAACTRGNSRKAVAN